jgi:hypothetical protein
VIGTLNEGTLHAQLKEWYAEEGDLFEQPVDGYVIDLVRGDLLVEIQTGGFSPLRRKLSRLLEDHPIVVVAPIARARRIMKMGEEGEVLSSRRSPKHGRFEDVFGRLVSFPGLIGHDNFSLDLLLTTEDEYRVHQPGKAWRRKGWVTVGRALESVEDSRRIASSGDLVAFLPSDLPTPFTTADLAEALQAPRRLAQQMVFCLRDLGELQMTGKVGNAIEYSLPE